VEDYYEIIEDLEKKGKWKGNENTAKNKKQRSILASISGALKIIKSNKPFLLIFIPGHKKTTLLI